MKNKSSLSLNKNSVTNKINIGQCIKVANISLYVLAAICFMVYATQNYTHAEGDDEDLGYDITSANASVTVGTACTFTATVDSEHNATIANGIYSTDIGKTTLNTICNDSGGYAVYAIGYTGDEYGATDLTSDISSTYNISTGTNTSGDSSSWAMKLAQEPGTTTATIENGYNSYNIVPDDYTKVATLNTITDPGTSTSGSSVSTTYQTYISPTQPAGTYSGKVKYTLVHPSTSPKPEVPVYMQDVAQWKDRLANVGDSLRTVDKRDGKIYWVTKEADGNIWMTQNLDLDLSTSRTFTPIDTDITTNWTPNHNTIKFTGTFVDGWHDISAYAPRSADPGDIYYYTSGSNSDDIIYNSLEACEEEHAEAECKHYHAGNYYNYYAAIAQSTQGSICPKGWRLPSNINTSSPKGTGDFYNLLSIVDGIFGEEAPSYIGGFYYTENGLNIVRNMPLWFVRNGSIGDYGSLNYSAQGGGYMTHDSGNSSACFRFYFYTSYINPYVSSTIDSASSSIRCLAR